MTARPAWALTPARSCVRLANPDDRDGVAAFLAAMEPEGLYARHFSVGTAPNLVLLDRLDSVDHHDHVVVLHIGHDGQLLGHAEYVSENGEAEFAMIVLPKLRGCGIGSQMLAELVDIASAAGHHEMHGIIQATNVPMLKLASRSGFEVKSGTDRSTVIVHRNLPAVETGQARHLPEPGKEVTATITSNLGREAFEDTANNIRGLRSVLS